MASPTKSKVRKKRIKRNLPKGVVHIQATFNNTMISVTDDSGNVVAWEIEKKLPEETFVSKVELAEQSDAA